MKKLYLAIFLCFFPLASAFAVNVASIYQAEVPVITQADDLKDQAIKDGFLQVLIKVSGDPDIGKNPVIKRSLQKAAYYVAEYNYSSPTTASSEYMLQIRYEPEDVIRLLKKAKVAYWRENRPLILIWVAVTNKQQETEIIDNETPGGVFNVIKNQSKKYGLPLIFPIMDTADMDLVSANDITSMSIATLKEAAKRYSPDAILIGRIEETEGNTESQWQLIFNDNTWDYSITDQSTENVIASLMDQVQKTIAKNYLVKTANVEPTWLNLEITHIAEREDLKKIIQFLEQLTSVQQVKLLQVANNMVQLSVEVHGTRDTFQQNALVNQHLVLNLQDTNEDKIVYDWVR